MRYRAFDDDPDLDTVAFPHNIIGIEVEGHHLAWLDRSAEFREDIAVAVEELAANDNYGGGSGVGCRHPSGLAKSDADRATVNNECLGLGCAERKKGQQDGDEHWCCGSCFHNFSFLGCDICPARLLFAPAWMCLYPLKRKPRPKTTIWQENFLCM